MIIPMQHLLSWATYCTHQDFCWEKGTALKESQASWAVFCPEYSNILKAKTLAIS